jgi:hypothetical protein
MIMTSLLNLPRFIGDKIRFKIRFFYFNRRISAKSAEIRVPILFSYIKIQFVRHI